MPTGTSNSPGGARFDVVPYRPEWPGLFRRHAERIAAAKTELIEEILRASDTD